MDRQTWATMTPEQQAEWARFQQWQSQQQRATTATQIPAPRTPAPAGAAPARSKNRRIWPWVAVTSVLALAAISGVALSATSAPSDIAVAEPAAAAPAATPEQAYLADILDTPGLTSSMSDQDTIAIGRGACEVMAYQSYSRDDLVAEFGATKFGPQVAGVMIDAAHRNLCPQYTFPLVSSAAPVQAGSSSASMPAGPVTSASDGTYEVGVDLEAGRYKTTGPVPGARSCYQARLSDDSGDSSSILSNDLTDGPSSVTVADGEFIKFNGGCTWTKQQ